MNPFIPWKSLFILVCNMLCHGCIAGHTLVGLAADCKDRKFYFSDINTGTISRASLDNTSDSQVIIDGKIQHAFKVDVQFVVCG